MPVGGFKDRDGQRVYGEGYGQTVGDRTAKGVDGNGRGRGDRLKLCFIPEFVVHALGQEEGIGGGTNKDVAAGVDGEGRVRSVKGNGLPDERIEEVLALRRTLARSQGEDRIALLTAALGRPLRSPKALPRRAFNTAMTGMNAPAHAAHIAYRILVMTHPQAHGQRLHVDKQPTGQVLLWSRDGAADAISRPNEQTTVSYGYVVQCV